MNWPSQGRELDQWMLKHYRDRTGSELPEALQWFLTNVANGAALEESIHIPFEGDGPETELCLSGVYGLDNLFKLYAFNLLNDFPALEGPTFPVGVDDFDGQTVLALRGSHEGEVWHIPLEEIHRWEMEDAAPFAEGALVPEMAEEIYFVAKDLREFARLIDAG